MVINNFLQKYEVFILLGDFNLSTTNKRLADLVTFFNLESLIITPIWFLSKTPNCIDLILTNKKSLLKNSRTLKLWISDHHHLVFTSVRSQYIWGNPKIKFYRDYKHYNFESFNNELNELLQAANDINYSLF